MNNHKHTPGPWKIGVRQPTSDKFIYSSNGGEVADCDRKTNFHDENLANARLIASAPELLDACELLFKTLDALDYFRDCPEAMMLKRVIAKAKGETL